MMKHAQQAAMQDSISNALRIERIRRTRRAQVGKLTAEQVEEMVHSPLTLDQAAAHYGVNRSLVYKHRRRASARRVGTVWAGLGSRTNV